MKTMQFTHYGAPDALRLTEVATPAPKADEVLVKIHAAAVNFGDSALMRGEPFLIRLTYQGINKPKITTLGADIAGVVTAVGERVTRFKVGDEVYGDLSKVGFGGFAEYVAVPESAVTFKPRRLSFEQAAAVPTAAVVALQGLRDKGKLQAGHTVLVHGASGGIGSFAVQIAKAYGAEVTAVCSARNAEMMRALGADHVVDYTQEDFTRNGRLYDLIFDVAARRSLFYYRRALRPHGRYVLAGGSIARLFQALLLGPVLSRAGGKKVLAFEVKVNTADLDTLTALLEAGTIRAVIERCYPLAALPEAIRHYETRHARGKIVVTVAAQGA